ncbi:MBG domain-containing protein [Furfurilactobacillus rossiae]|uniref:MBG domain-containing protein n=1 Tax=Furfurilactobacillus rossiae TaxID=231049 RepID=UPI001EFF205A|nr:MBG domain-containing protein [Furfurilactobacillus rossiae]MCF6165187.1 MucBP domain-containing protein [Furfurilactobacillus rossiae]
MYWIEKLDQNGQPYATPDDKTTYDVIGKVQADDMALTDSKVTLTGYERNEHFNQLKAKSDPTAAINFATFYPVSSANKFAHVDQNVQILGNGQTNINVYYALNSYTFNFDFKSNHYTLNNQSNTPIYTDDLYVVQNNNTNTKSYVLTAKYGQDISAVWPIVNGNGQYYPYGPRYSNYSYDAHFAGWTGGAARVLWVTKRVALTQDMLTKATTGDGSVINMTPEFLTEGNYNLSETHYYLQSIVQQPTSTNIFYNNKYYDLLTNYEDNFIMSGTQLSSKQIPGTPVIAHQAAIEGVPDDNGTEIFNLYYDRQSYTLSFDDQTPGDKISTHSFLFGASISSANFPTPSRAGYVFDGWYVDANGTQPFTQNGQPEFSTMPARNVTLFAKWTESTYHIHYYADYNDMINGKELTSLAQVYAQNDEAKTPATYNASTIDPDRGRFLNWNYMVGSSAVALKNGLLITRDYNVFGSYDAVHFNIAYQVGSDHKSPVSDNSKYGLGTTIRLADEPANWSANSDEVFLGWSYTDQDGKKHNYLPGDFVKIDHNLVNVSAASADQTLTFTERYATKESTISVTFVPNDPDNQSMPNQVISAEKNSTVRALTQSSLNVFNLPLLGWSTSETTTATTMPSLNDIATGTNNVTLYGHWLKVTLSGSKVYDGKTTDDNQLDTQYTVTLNDVSGNATTLMNSGSLTSADFTRTAGKDVGTYVLSLNQFGFDALRQANPTYDFSNVNLSELPTGSFTIVPKKVRVTPKPGSKVYGQSDPSDIFNVNTPEALNGDPNIGIVIGDDNIYQVKRTSSADGKDGVGTYTISVSAAENPNPNYILVPGDSATFTITPRPILVTANNATKVFGNDDSTFSATSSAIGGNPVSGLVNNDQLNYTVSRETGEKPGNYRISVTNGLNSNYMVTTADGTLTITPVVTVSYVDQDGNQLATVPAKTVNDQQVGNTISIDQPTVVGYELVPSQPTSYTLTDQGNQSITVKYRQNTTVTANYYVNGTTTKIGDSIVTNGAAGLNYQTSAANVDGYTLVATPDNAQGIYAPTGNTVNYYYTVNYTALPVDSKGNKIANGLLGTGTPGQSIQSSVNLPAIPGYALSETMPTVPDTPGVTVNVVYTPLSESVNVNYYLKGTTNKIKDSTIISGDFNAQYVAPTAQITGYTLDETPANATGTFGTTNKDVDYFYTADTESVESRYLVQGTETALTDPTIVKGAFNTQYAAASKDIVGYKLVGTPANATGTFGITNAPVIYEYAPLPESISVNYYLKGTTNKVAASTIVNGFFDGKYSAVAAKVDGYKLAITPANANGTFGTNTAEVNYEYVPLQETISANYYILGTTDKIAATKIMSGNFNSQYTTSAAQIDGYTLSERPANATGLFATTNDDVNYYYTIDYKATPTIGSSSSSYDGASISSKYVPTLQIQPVSTAYNGTVPNVTLAAEDYTFTNESGQNVDPTAESNVGRYAWQLTATGIQYVQKQLGTAFTQTDLTNISGHYEITPANLIVTTTNNTKVFGEKDPQLTATITGTMGSDVITVSTSRDAGESVGTYNVSSSVNADSQTLRNYTITNTDGIFTITPAVATVSIVKFSKVYDGTAELPTIQFQSEQNLQMPTNLNRDDFVITSVIKGSSDLIQAGTYQVQITASGLKKIQDANKDYTISSVHPGTYFINKKKLSLKATDQHKVVGDQNLDLSFTAAGLISSDSVKAHVEIASNPTPIRNGHYELLVIVDNEDELTNNYDVATDPGSLYVSVKPVSTADIKIGNTQKVYDGQPAVVPNNLFALTMPAFMQQAALTSDDFDISPITGTTDLTGAGTYTIQLNKIGLTKLKTQNIDYSFDGVTSGLYTIQKAKVNAAEFKPVVADKTYNAQPVPSVYTINVPNLIKMPASLTATDFTILASTANNQDVGQYSVSLSESGLAKFREANSNLDIIGGPAVATFKVTPAPLTVTMHHAEKTFGDPDSYASDVVGWLDSNPYELVYTRSNMNEDKGTYDVNVAVKNAQNYTVTTLGAPLTIKSYADLNVTDITLTQGDTWNPSMNFVNAKNDHGVPVDWQEFIMQNGIVKNADNVNTLKPGVYTVIYIFGDPVVKTATVTVKGPATNVPESANESQRSQASQQDNISVQSQASATSHQENTSSSVHVSQLSQAVQESAMASRVSEQQNNSKTTQSLVQQKAQTLKSRAATDAVTSNVNSKSISVKDPSVSESSVTSKPTLASKEKTTELPHTGEHANTVAAEVGLGLLGTLLALAGLKRRKRDEDSND